MQESGTRCRCSICGQFTPWNSTFQYVPDSAYSVETMEWYCDQHKDWVKYPGDGVKFGDALY